MINSRVIKYFLLAYGIITIAIIYPMSQYYGGFLNFCKIGPGIPGGIFNRFLFFLGTGSIATILGAYGVIASALRKEEQDKSERQWIKVIRWTARTISLLYVLLTVSIFAAHQIFHYFPRTELLPILPVVLGALMVIGLGLAWKWELPGAVISLVAFIGISIVDPNALRESTWYIVPTTAVLFLLCWWSGRSARRTLE